MQTRLRPHAYLRRRGSGAIVAFFVPTFAVLYFLTVPDGPWVAVLVAQVIVAIGAGFAILNHARVGVWVSPDSITERGFFGITRRYSRDQLGPTVFVDMYHGGGVDTVPQLFICAPDGRQVIRLRGQFWPREVMQTVLTTLDVAVVEIDHPVSASELHERYPGLLYWFEHRRVLAAIVFAGILVLGCAVIYAILSLLGMTG